MTVVDVTLTLGATCHYWLTPRAAEDTSGAGITVPDIVHGWIAPDDDGTPASITWQLDSAYAWDVTLEMRNAPPVVFSGFEPGSGGDLLTLLAAQGWAPL